MIPRTPKCCRKQVGSLLRSWRPAMFQDAIYFLQAIPLLRATFLQFMIMHSSVLVMYSQLR